MTQTEVDRIMKLCELICHEHDTSKFQKLVTELNELLTEKEQNLKRSPGPAS
jgi:hypothetical protein